MQSYKRCAKFKTWFQTEWKDDTSLSALKPSFVRTILLDNDYWIVEEEVHNCRLHVHQIFCGSAIRLSICSTTDKRRHTADLPYLQRKQWTNATSTRQRSRECLGEEFSGAKWGRQHFRSRWRRFESKQRKYKIFKPKWNRANRRLDVRCRRRRARYIFRCWFF